jgi:hypothetical protein
MPTNFECSGDFADWPKNVPGKPTQAAVFGVYHPTKGRTCQILWTGRFPDLEPAMYWAAKKELEAVRRGKWYAASRVLWQHALTPEQAVAAAQQQMEPQLDRALDAAENGHRDIDLGQGPMHPVRPEDAHGYYVEFASPGNDDPSNDPLPPMWLLPNDPPRKSS